MIKQCAIGSCKKEAQIFNSWLGIKDSIGLCKKHHLSWVEHEAARMEMFRQQGKQDAQEEFIKLIKKFEAHMTWNDKKKYWMCPEENLEAFKCEASQSQIINYIIPEVEEELKKAIMQSHSDTEKDLEVGEVTDSDKVKPTHIQTNTTTEKGVKKDEF